MATHKGLLFALGHFNLCCPAESMEEVILISRDRIREIPGVRSLFRGIFIYRDSVLPLLNLALLFQLGDSNPDIIAIGVMKLSSGERFGLTISEKTEIITYEDHDIEELDRSPRGIDRRYFQGYMHGFGRMVFVLNIDSFESYLVARAKV